MQLPRLVTKPGISQEEIPTQQGLKQLHVRSVSLIQSREKGDPIPSHILFKCSLTYFINIEKDIN
jgi:hypothetical protein